MGVSASPLPQLELIFSILSFSLFPFWSYFPFDNLEAVLDRICGVYGARDAEFYGTYVKAFLSGTFGSYSFFWASSICL